MNYHCDMPPIRKPLSFRLREDCVPKVNFHLQQLMASQAGLGLQIVGAMTWHSVWCSLPRAHPTIPQRKTIQSP
jgi:hypothetical protein